MTEREKVTIDEIVSIVKTDEPTDSVEEVRKLRGREGMVEKPKKTPKEELKCPKKYVYDAGIIFECKNDCKFQILGEDVVKLLNELTTKCSQLEKENEELKFALNQRTEQLDKYYEENEQLINRIKDLEELKRIYVDFLVSEGYELADVMKGDVE